MHRRMVFYKRDFLEDKFFQMPDRAFSLSYVVLLSKHILLNTFDKRRFVTFFCHAHLYP